ncbi:PREDICTED: very long-chain acyl-CoA synthetase-like, partial [Poecilia mexicana]|uniref:very long-chain acyl-CoA synthetase-like n=1 Tax=Poecilia mexicana TaxID=48701 RepID=UPI00072E4480
MSVWLTAAAGLAILAFAYIRTFCPYFSDDCAYMLRSLKLGIRLIKYRKSKPFYSILDCFLDAVKRQPNKIFIHFEGRAFSYGEMDLQSNKVARALQAEARLKEGDAVALFLPNEPSFVWTWLGLAKLGCPAALLNFNIRSKSLLHCFSCCGAKVLITAPGTTADDIFYINLPLYHSAGFLIGMTGGIERGLTLVLRRKFSASQFWDDCRKYNVTAIQYIGETMRYLCNMPKKENEKNHKVRIAIGNGVRSDVWSEFLNRFGDIKVRELYAATEGNIGFINYTSKIGAVGRINFLHQIFFPYTLI